MKSVFYQIRLSESKSEQKYGRFNGTGQICRGSTAQTKQDEVLLSTAAVKEIKPDGSFLDGRQFLVTSELVAAIKKAQLFNLFFSSVFNVSSFASPEFQRDSSIHFKVSSSKLMTYSIR